MRTVICGGPKTGKTTLSQSHPPPVHHTDDYIHLGWGQCSQIIADQFLCEPGPWTIEGVAAVRGLRKWLMTNPDGKPCDRVILLTEVKGDGYTQKHEAMAKGVLTIFQEIEGELLSRGVEVIRQ